MGCSKLGVVLICDCDIRGVQLSGLLDYWMDGRQGHRPGTQSGSREGGGGTIEGREEGLRKIREIVRKHRTKVQSE